MVQLNFEQVNTIDGSSMHGTPNAGTRVHDAYT